MSERDLFGDARGPEGAGGPLRRRMGCDSPTPLQSVLEEDLGDVTPAAMIACVKREIALRARVYPGLVRTRKTIARTAEHEQRAMRAVLKALLLRFPEEPRS